MSANRKSISLLLMLSVCAADRWLAFVAARLAQRQ